MKVTAIIRGGDNTPVRLKYYTGSDPLAVIQSITQLLQDPSDSTMPESIRTRTLSIQIDLEDGVNPLIGHEPHDALNYFIDAVIGHHQVRYGFGVAGEQFYIDTPDEDEPNYVVGVQDRD